MTANTTQDSLKSLSELPFEGEFFFARERKFSELVFFIHFYEGSKRQLLRHIKLVNSFGFDAFAFHLQGDLSDLKKGRLPISSQGQFGTKHVYADQIEHLLNLIPGIKIVYSFSNPSASAIEALARRHCVDVKALVCDSGPTAQFIPSAQKLFSVNYNVKPWALSWALAPLLSVGWSPLLHKDLPAQLAHFPDQFPVLSIRGGKDELIPPEHIEQVFKGHPHLDVASVYLPQAWHLKGLRDFRDDYIPPVREFLLKVARPE